MNKILALILLSIFSVSSFAGRFWTGDLGSWTLYLNNNVAYVTSTAFPDECTYNRAQINFPSEPFDAYDEYMKGIFAYILAASKTGESLKVVLDHDQGSSADTVTCVILSAQSS